MHCRQGPRPTIGLLAGPLAKLLAGPLVVAACLLAKPAAGAGAAPDLDPRLDPRLDPGARREAAGALCDEAVALAENAENIPRHLLAAVAAAESGRPVAAGRSAGPWPWTVTAQGQGRYFATKTDAIEAVADLLGIGIGNIDVGCMQINLSYHPEAFASLDEAFDPLANAAYGAVYLRALFMATGSWPEAIGRYHSATRQFNSAYRKRVLALWNARRAQPAQTPPNGGAIARGERSDADDLAASVNTVSPRSRSATTHWRGASSPTLGSEAVDELKARLQAMTPP